MLETILSEMDRKKKDRNKAGGKVSGAIPLFNASVETDKTSELESRREETLQNDNKSDVKKEETQKLFGGQRLRLWY